METLPFAVVVVARTIDGQIAATTRPNEPGRIGLPGGKLDPGETPLEAILRECEEEGWHIELPENAKPVHSAMVEGNMLWWYVSQSIATPMDDFKEKHRMETLAVHYDVMANVGYGNEWLLNYDIDSLFDSAIEEVSPSI